MGYDTDIIGELHLSPPLNQAQIDYLNKFSETRRVIRSPKEVKELPDPLRIAVGIQEVGIDAEYYVGGKSYDVCKSDVGVIDVNMPPGRQPGLWCQWVPTDDGTKLIWNDSEKFYEYIKWLRYIINHFLKRWGITSNGQIFWDGEDVLDIGTITVINNKVTSRKFKFKENERGDVIDYIKSVVPSVSE